MDCLVAVVIVLVVIVIVLLLYFCSYYYLCCCYGFCCYITKVKLTHSFGESSLVLQLAFQIYHPGLQNVALICIHITTWCMVPLFHPAFPNVVY